MDYVSAGFGGVLIYRGLGHQFVVKVVHKGCWFRSIWLNFVGTVQKLGLTRSCEFS